MPEVSEYLIEEIATNTKAKDRSLRQLLQWPVYTL